MGTGSEQIAVKPRSNCVDPVFEATKPDLRVDAK